MLFALVVPALAPLASLASVLAKSLLLAQLAGPAAPPGSFPFSLSPFALPWETPAAETSAPAATPTTVPAASTPGDGAKQSIIDDLNKTTFAKLFSGKKQLTPGEAVTFRFWLNAFKDLIFTAIGFLPRLFVAVLFLLLFWGIYRGIRRVVLGSMAKAHVDSSIRDMLGAVIKYAVMGFGLVIACNQVGIQISALLTGVSIIGLAIGFAAQETLANFIAGVVIFWDKPFKVGDWLDVDGRYGKVLRVSFRSTRLLNLDGEVIIMPNTSVLAQKVTNHSTNPINRVNVKIGIAYKESIDAARAALLTTTAGDARVCRDPSPSVVVDACGDSSVNLLLRFWIRDESIEKQILHEYTEKAKKALDAANITIPFPHVQLLIDDASAAGMNSFRNTKREEPAARRKVG